jgi:hypothetical protein
LRTTVGLIRDPEAACHEEGDQARKQPVVRADEIQFLIHMLHQIPPSLGVMGAASSHSWKSAYLAREEENLLMYLILYSCKRLLSSIFYLLFNLRKAPKDRINLL